ncbi:hypothetical protein [Streptomyces filamentosus]|uniref:hypothetical protein n=1 Tax=Streptomyces filamentosus TaxID=67294 RepID=UPI003325B9FD
MTSGPVLTPDCELDVHISCRTAEVVVEGIVIVKAGRCDCSCHKELKRGTRGEDVPAMPQADPR